MVAHGDEEVKEQFASLFHLHLHRAASLESRPASDDEGKIVSSEFRFMVGSVGVGVARTCEDSATLNAGVKALLDEG